MFMYRIMTLPGIITVLIGIACLVQGLTITSPSKGDKIDIQKGLTVSWTTDNSDKTSTNVTIDLFLKESFYEVLTSGESKSAVPITDLNYTFQYMPDKTYIAAQKGYVIRLYDGSASEYESGEFEIFNTKNFVTSVPTTTVPAPTPRNPSGSPSLRLSSTPASSRALSTPTSATPSPSASANAANGLIRGDMRADTVALLTITVPLVYTLVLLCVQGWHRF